MRNLEVARITEEVARLVGEADLLLPADVRQALTRARDAEPSPVGREVLDRLLENADIARDESLPICQDCGLAVIFLDLGQDVHLTGGALVEAVNQGVREGYARHHLRKSVCHPFTRANTGDNTPALVHVRVVPGDQVRLWVVPKGGGSENMSKVFLLTPAMGRDGVKEKVLETVEAAGPNPCPPIVVSVAVGGTFDEAGLRAKRGLLRHLGQPSPDPEAAALEEELFTLINNTGIGPAGLGGRTTALGVFVDIAPCHIASLPLAVNIQCHAARHKEAVL
ncbi:MAG: fumarate hydratase [Deltaproteobacteria bacterium]|nr:fumarate hydratase [Deltaproteobacteria bacterium]